MQTGNYGNVSLIPSDGSGSSILISFDGIVSNLNLAISNSSDIMFSYFDLKKTAKLHNSLITVTVPDLPLDTSQTVRLGAMTFEDARFVFASASPSNIPLNLYSTGSNVVITLKDDGLVHWFGSPFLPIQEPQILDSVFTVLYAPADDKHLNDLVRVISSDSSNFTLPFGSNIGFLRSLLPVDRVELIIGSSISNAAFVAHVTPSQGTVVTIGIGSRLRDAKTIFDGPSPPGTWSRLNMNTLVMNGEGDKKAIMSSSSLAISRLTTADVCVSVSLRFAYLSRVRLNCDDRYRENPDASVHCPLLIQNSTIQDCQTCVFGGSEEKPGRVYPLPHIASSILEMTNPQSFTIFEGVQVEAEYVTFANGISQSGPSQNASMALQFAKNVTFAFGSTISTNSLYLHAGSSLIIPGLSLYLPEYLVIGAGASLSQGISGLPWNLFGASRFTGSSDRRSGDAPGVVNFSGVTLNLYPTKDVGTWDNPIIYADPTAVATIVKEGLPSNTVVYWYSTTIGSMPTIGKPYYILKQINYTDATKSSGPSFMLGRGSAILEFSGYYDATTRSAIFGLPGKSSLVPSAPNYRCVGSIKNPNFYCADLAWRYNGATLVLDSELIIESPAALPPHAENTEARVSNLLLNLTSKGSIVLSGLKSSISLANCYPTHYTNGQPVGTSSLKLDLSNIIVDPTTTSSTLILLSQPSHCPTPAHQISYQVTLPKCYHYKVNTLTSNPHLLQVTLERTGDNYCDGRRLGIIIGCSVAGGIVAIIVAVIIARCCCCKRPKAGEYQPINSY